MIRHIPLVSQANRLVVSQPDKTNANQGLDYRRATRASESDGRVPRESSDPLLGRTTILIT